MKKKKNIKKRLPIIIFIVAIFALIVVIPILSEQNSIFTKINLTELKENIKNEEFTFIYIGAPDCIHCTAMKPALADVKEKFPDVNILYLDFSRLTNSEKTELRGLDDRLANIGTPTFLFVRYGEIVGTKSGQTTSSEEFVTLFSEYYYADNLYEEFDAKTFISKFKSNETSVIFIGQTTCPHCDDFKPTVNSVINEYGTKIYHIDFDILSNADKKAIAELDETFEKFGTPLTIVVKNGKILDKLTGGTTREILVNFLKDNKVIVED